MPADRKRRGRAQVSPSVKCDTQDLRLLSSSGTPPDPVRGDLQPIPLIEAYPGVLLPRRLRDPNRCGSRRSAASGSLYYQGSELRSLRFVSRPAAPPGNGSCAASCAPIRSTIAPSPIRTGRAREGRAASVKRIIELKRTLAAVERGKYEHERSSIAPASAQPGADSRRRLHQDFAALRPWRPASWLSSPVRRVAGIHEVIAVRATSEQLEQQLGEREPAHWRSLASPRRSSRFRDGACLVSMAVKNRHHMPANG